MGQRHNIRFMGGILDINISGDNVVSVYDVDVNVVCVVVVDDVDERYLLLFVCFMN